MKAVLLFCMFFCHIVDDYYLQGILASMKQKKWWQEHASAAFYKNDYKIALLMHSFSWAFTIMVPLLIYTAIYNSEDIFFFYVFYPLLIVCNTLVHMFIDNLKANKLSINLIFDQCVHIIQICVTYILFMAH